MTPGLYYKLFVKQSLRLHLECVERVSSVSAFMAPEKADRSIWTSTFLTKANIFSVRFGATA